MYLVLARKYRPQNFEEVIGQSHIVQTLKKAINEGKTAHVYLFSGPRGIGKTSMARIFAKGLNCEKGPTISPCNKCELCKEISAGSSIDVLEIDGASNRGIEEIRALRENVNLMPSKGRYKIYIIDEVHMLTTDAFNALLKTLEEPPEYVKFIFATTSPEKLPSTILSRCQRFEFKPLTPSEIKMQIEKIAKKEKIEIEEKAIEKIIEFSSGSMRDSLSILDQLIVYGEENKIRLSDVQTLLGLVEEKSIEQLLIYIKKGNVKNSVSLLHQLLKEGKDPGILLDGIIKKIRNIGFLKIGEKDFYQEDKEFLSYFENISLEKILEALTLAIEYKEKIRIESLQIVILEVLFLKLSKILHTEEQGKISFSENRVEQDIFTSIEPTTSPTELNRGTTTEFETKEEIREEKTELTIEEIEKNRDKILSEIKKLKPTIEACLREGKFAKFQDNTLFILFPQKFPYHKSMVEKPQNKKIIEETILKVLGINCKISCMFNQEIQESSVLEEKEIKEIIKLFDGEVLKVEE